MWQDAVLTVGSLIFAFALLPSVVGEHKPSLWTSATTAVTLFVFAGVYFSLDLTFAMWTTTATASMWATLLVQRMRQV